MKQRIISIAAALALCLSLLPGTALAADETPTGVTICHNTNGTDYMVSLEAGKTYVASEEIPKIKEWDGGGTPTGPYLSYDGTTLTVNGNFQLDAQIYVYSNLTITGDGESSLTLPDPQYVKFFNSSTLTLSGEVNFTVNALTFQGTLAATEEYSGSIVVISGSTNVAYDVKNSGSIDIQGIVACSEDQAVTLKSTGNVTLSQGFPTDLRCKTATLEGADVSLTSSEGNAAYTGDSLTITAENTVTITSAGVPVLAQGENPGGLTVTKAQSVTISGASSGSSAFFPVPVKFENCGSVRVTDSGDGAFLKEGVALTSAAPVSVRKDGKDKLYLDGTLWDDGGTAPEGLLSLTRIATPTYWKAGNGRIYYEPSAGADTPAKLTLDSATYAGTIYADDANGLDVTVNGSNQTGSMTINSGSVTLTGDGNLRAENITTQRGNTIDNRITGTLNTITLQYGGTGNKDTYTVYGEAELSDGLELSDTDGDLTIQPGATLTIPKGEELWIEKLDCLKNNGSIINNGAVTLAGAAATGADAETVRGLNLSGSGKVQVMAGNGEITAAYTNSGEERLTPVDQLDLSNTPTADDTHWDSKGYKWENVTKDASGNITGGTLTLAEGFEARKVTLPDATVTIVTTGESLIGELSPPIVISSTHADKLKLTFSGPGPLTITDHVEISGGAGNSITVDEGAKVTANNGISIGMSGGVDGTVTVNGILTVKQGTGVSAINTGRVAVGDKGVLEVSGSKGVALNGMNSSTDYTNLFTVTGNGRFTADCSGSNISVTVAAPSKLPQDDSGNADAKKVINLGPEYMPDDCEVRFNEAKTSIDLIRISANEVYTGPLTIHKNHTWETGWDNDRDTHWHPCEFAGCTEKQPNSEAAHFYRSCVCTICGYVAPAGTPDSSSGGGGSDRDSSYTVTVERSTHGTVTSDRRTASRGDTVTLTVTADSGYALDVLTVTDSRGDAVKLTERGGKYTFTMPGRDVTVRASFAAAEEKTCPKDSTCPIWPYTDARTTAWYHDGVHYCLENGLMNGYSADRFGPNDPISRAQLAQLLHNREGRPVVNYLLPFTDVPEGKWYSEAVRWAASEGFVEGYGDGRFGPADPITRQQLAVLLWRYAGSPASSGSPLTFQDADAVSAYAREALQWAVENGVVNGKGGDLLDPRGTATRAEAAAMLMRFLSR